VCEGGALSPRKARWAHLLAVKGGRMSWISALLLMWRGKAVGLGVNYKLKSLWLTSAVIFSVAAPVLEYSDCQNYAGARPPDVPMIKAVGMVVRHVGRNGVKQVPYFLFTSEEGAVYRTENRVAPGILDDLGQLKTPRKVRIEGFFLNDGKGSFYPLKVSDMHGTDLVLPDKLKNQLFIGGNPFYYKKIFTYFSVISVQWMFSFFYAWKLRIASTLAS